MWRGRSDGGKLGGMTDIYKLLDYSCMMREKAGERKRLLQSGGLRERRVAVLCGSTFGVIKDFLEIFLLHYGIRPVFHIGEFNRFYEEAVFNSGSLVGFKPDVILVHVTNRNLLWNYQPEAIEEEKKRMGRIWEALTQKAHGSVIVQNNFEYFRYRIIGNAARTRADGSVNYVDEANRLISDYAEANKDFYVNDINYLSSYVGIRNWSDDRLWDMYKYPMAMCEMPRYALNIANIIKSAFGGNRKTIITDLDNTLWGGEIGEIGVENIKLGNGMPQGGEYERLHYYLKYLSMHGIVLNICSKNEYQTGISGIRSESSVLREGDFAVKKINWKSKAENVDRILRELNLLESSAVFMDDSPVECDNVKSMFPEIAAVQAEGGRGFLEEMEALSFFEVTQETQEDRERGRYYEGNQKRRAARQEYGTYGEYLKSLGMVCHVDKVCGQNMGRVVQLMNKTNQFNFMTRRYTSEAMDAVVNGQGYETLALDLTDRFGSNGIVSVAVVRFEGMSAHVHDWIMSCRVFERGLELVMLRLICESCLRKGIGALHGYYRRTDKNGKIAGFYQEMGFEKRGRLPDGTQEWACGDIHGLLKRCREGNILVVRSGTGTE